MMQKYQQLMQDLSESGTTAPKQIEKAFKLMDEKPKDLIKPIIYTDDL